MINIQSLRIDYDNVNAVNDMNLHVPEGQIFGLVGPNGSGKTSTIKALAGILEPTYGQIHIGGHDLDLQREKALEMVGYMPDFSPVYENLKVWEYLDVFAAAYLIKAEDRPPQIDHWLDKVKLTVKKDSFIKNLSRGMRQRLVLAKTLLPHPKVLFLDEPASGLDPISRKDMRDIFKEVAGHGATIFISSHILSELREFCNAVGIMEKGRLIVAGDLNQIREQIKSTGKLIVRLTDITQDRRNDLKATVGKSSHIQGVFKETSNEIVFNYIGEEKIANGILTELIHKQFPVCEYFIQKDDVEDIFFKIGAKEAS